MNKPIWYAEPSERFWLIHCRFMLDGKKAGLTEALSTDAGIEHAPKIITQMNIRRERFIAEDLIHA